MPQRMESAALELIRNISRLTDSELAKRLDSLPVESQVEVFLSSNWSDRLRIVKNSNLAPELVKALPEEEVYLTMKAVGMEDGLLLFQHTSPEQMRFVLDVELWERDLVSDEKSTEWLRYIVACGEDKIMDFVKTCDLELLAVVLRKILHLIPNEEGVQVPEELPSIMIDEFFTILSKSPADTETMRIFLMTVRANDRDLFYKLLFSAYWLIEAEAEEEAYRWRTSRLEEKGLLDFEEAVEIYAYISEKEAYHIVEEKDRIYYSPEDVSYAPTYPVLLYDRRTFLYEIMMSLTDRQLQNRLRREIAFAANRLIVADSREIGEIDSISQALRRLFALANLGLLFVSGTDQRKARAILHDVAIKELFQIGFSRVLDLKHFAREVVWKWWYRWKDDGFVFMEYPVSEVFKGLMMRVPQYYALDKGEDVDFRDFETLAELKEVREIVETTAVVAEALFES